jgi:hypothetical protein
MLAGVTGGVGRRRAGRVIHPFIVATSRAGIDNRTQSIGNFFEAGNMCGDDSNRSGFAGSTNSPASSFKKSMPES